jgi:hypothetical protein
LCCVFEINSAAFVPVSGNFPERNYVSAKLFPYSNLYERNGVPNLVRMGSDFCSRHKYNCVACDLHGRTILTLCSFNVLPSGIWIPHTSHV